MNTYKCKDCAHKDPFEHEGNLWCTMLGIKRGKEEPACKVGFSLLKEGNYGKTMDKKSQ